MWRSRRLHRLARLLLLLVACGPAAVLLLEHFRATQVIGSALRWAYGLQCHQRAARTFTWDGTLLPVCARCLGIYLGLGLAGLVDRPRLRPNAYKVWLLVAGLLVLVDVATEWVGLRPPSPWFRSVIGAVLSSGMALAILGSLRPRSRSTWWHGVASRI